MRVRTLGSFMIAAVLGGIVLSPAVGSAQTPPPPPLSCTITIGTATISVQSNQELDPTTPFPESVPAVQCPSPLTGGDCLRWRYKYTHNAGGNIALTGATVTSDATTAVATTGVPPADSSTGSQVSNPGDGDISLGLARNVFDVRVARFASGGPTVFGNVYTPTNVNMGKVTAAAKIGNALGFCAIAGPANFAPPGPGKVAVTTTIIDQAGQCLIARQVDGAGCTVSIDSMTPGCTVGSPDSAFLGSTNEQLSGLSCNTQITFGDNSSYCYASTFGRLVCVSSPAP